MCYQLDFLSRGRVRNRRKTLVPHPRRRQRGLLVRVLFGLDVPLVIVLILVVIKVVVVEVLVVFVLVVLTEVDLVDQLVSERSVPHERSSRDSQAPCRDG